MLGQDILVIITIIIGLILMIIGLYVQKAKAYHLIAGYNSLSKEKKEEFDIERYAKVFRNSFLVMGFLIIIAYPVLLSFHIEKYLSLVVIIIVVVGVFYLNYQGSLYSKKTNKGF